MNLRPYTVVAWTLAFLVLGELALELRAHARGFETLLFGPPAATLASDGTRFGRTEDFPFRSRKVPRERTAGVARVWLASASYAEDTTLEVERIWPVLLERELAGHGIDVEVINASRAGDSLITAADELEAEARGWSPDLIVVYHLSNDIRAIAAEQIGSGADRDHATPSSEGAGQAVDHWPTRVARTTTSYAQARNQIGARVARLLPASDDSSPEAIARAGDALEQRMRALTAVARDLGIPCAIATLACSHPEPATSLPGHYVLALRRDTPRLSPDGWRLWIAEGNQRLRQIAETERLALFDLARDPKIHPALFTDLFHFTPEGHEVVAERLANQLAPALLAFGEREE